MASSANGAASADALLSNAAEDDEEANGDCAVAGAAAEEEAETVEVAGRCFDPGPPSLTSAPAAPAALAPAAEAAAVGVPATLFLPPRFVAASTKSSASSCALRASSAACVAANCACFACSDASLLASNAANSCAVTGLMWLVISKGERSNTAKGAVDAAAARASEEDDDAAAAAAAEEAPDDGIACDCVCTTAEAAKGVCRISGDCVGSMPGGGGAQGVRGTLSSSFG